MFLEMELFGRNEWNFQRQQIHKRTTDGSAPAAALLYLLWCHLEEIVVVVVAS